MTETDPARPADPAPRPNLTPRTLDLSDVPLRLSFYGFAGSPHRHVSFNLGASWIVGVSTLRPGVDRVLVENGEGRTAHYTLRSSSVLGKDKAACVLVNGHFTGMPGEWPLDEEPPEPGMLERAKAWLLGVLGWLLGLLGRG